MIGGRSVETEAARGLAANSNHAHLDPEDVAALKSENERLGAALRAIEIESTSGSAEHQSKIRELVIQIEDKSREIATLKASLAAYETGLSTPRQAVGNAIQLKDNRIAMKARINALESQVGQQEELIRKLRAELAGANDLQARQAQHFHDEMRRLGAGTRPAGALPPSEPVQAAAALPSRRSLAQRISDAVPSVAAQLPENSPPSQLHPENKTVASGDSSPAKKRPSRLLDRIARLDERSS